MSASAANVKIVPINAKWEIEEQVCIDVLSVIAASLDGKYFNLYDEAGVNYNVFFDLDASGVVNPGTGTDVKVLVTTGDSAATMLAAMKTAIESATGYTGRIDGTRLFITLGNTGKVLTDSIDVDTAFSVSIVNKGGSIDLGLLDGNVEPSFSEDLLDVTAHQFGTSILSQLRQGNNAEVTLNLKESTKAIYDEIFEAGGDAFTPLSGTELVGWGDSKQGENTLGNSRRLVFHPVANDISDHTEDLTFWLAYPNPDSIVYSGEDFSILSVSFTTFLDLGKPRAIRRFAFGDTTQTGISI